MCEIQREAKKRKEKIIIFIFTTRMATKKNILDVKVSGKRGKERSRLTFKNTVSKILEEGHVKRMRNLPKGMYEEVDDSGPGEKGM